MDSMKLIIVFASIALAVACFSCIIDDCIDMIIDFVKEIRKDK